MQSFQIKPFTPRRANRSRRRRQRPSPVGIALIPVPTITNALHSGVPATRASSAPRSPDASAASRARNPACSLGTSTRSADRVSNIAVPWREHITSSTTPPSSYKGANGQDIHGRRGIARSLAFRIGLSGTLRASVVRNLVCGLAVASASLRVEMRRWATPASPSFQGRSLACGLDPTPGESGELRATADRRETTTMRKSPLQPEPLLRCVWRADDGREEGGVTSSSVSTFDRDHTCAFCVDLQRLAIRRRDPVVVEAAIRLREEHSRNDAERAAFAHAGARLAAPQQARRSSARMLIRGGDRDA